MIGERAESVERVKERACARLHGVGHLGGLLEQVGTSHVAHEHEVAREDAHRTGRRRLVGDHEREVLGRVPGRVQHVEADVADGNHIAVTQQRGAVLRGEGVLPIGTAFGREVQRAPVAAASSRAPETKSA
jgi:hypothetical protein